MSAPPRVSFYLLPFEGQNARWFFACQLTEKACGLGHQIYLQMACEKDAWQMDQMLWTFRQNSFLPHECYRANQEEYPPILVGHSSVAIPSIAVDLLVHMDWELPKSFDQFKRVAELVGPEKANRAHARTLYRYYQDQACSLDTYEIKR